MEVFIRCFDLSTTDFQEIVKASWKTKKLIFRACNIPCSKALNFATDSTYDTNFISFDYWGDHSRTSDFKSDPTLFENIVEGFGRCGLKFSLETVDVRGCKLEFALIKQMFEKHGMSNVKIVGTGAEPSKI